MAQVFHTLPQGGYLKLEYGMRLITEPYWYELEIEGFTIRVKLMCERSEENLGGGRIQRLYISKPATMFGRRLVPFFNEDLAVFCRGWSLLSEDPEVRRLLARVVAAFGETISLETNDDKRDDV